MCFGKMEHIHSLLHSKWIHWWNLSNDLLCCCLFFSQNQVQAHWKLQLTRIYLQVFIALTSMYKLTKVFVSVHVI